MNDKMIADSSITPASSGGNNSSDPALRQALLTSLDGLLAALRLESAGEDRFQVVSEPDRFNRTFGGQSIAQALMAASATVAGKALHSLHAYFIRAGVPGEPLELKVERIRDGRSMSTRLVSLVQGERKLLTLLASFHSGTNAETELAAPPPSVPQPEQMPLIQKWAGEVVPDFNEGGRIWIEQPPPLEFRIGEAPRFMGGSLGDSTRSHWMRLPRAVGDAPLLHTALLAYASDYLLMDMVFRLHPGLSAATGFNGLSVDHALWIHRPVRFDCWHLHTQEALAISGDRGLAKGMIHDRDGHLIATVMQEVLMLPVP